MLFETKWTKDHTRHFSKDIQIFRVVRKKHNIRNFQGNTNTNENELSPPLVLEWQLSKSENLMVIHKDVEKSCPYMLLMKMQINTVMENIMQVLHKIKNRATT